MSTPSRDDTLPLASASAIMRACESCSVQIGRQCMRAHAHHELRNLRRAEHVKLRARAQRCECLTTMRPRCARRARTAARSFWLALASSGASLAAMARRAHASAGLPISSAAFPCRFQSLASAVGDARTAALSARCNAQAAPTQRARLQEVGLCQQVQPRAANCAVLGSQQLLRARRVLKRLSRRRRARALSALGGAAHDAGHREAHARTQRFAQRGFAAPDGGRRRAGAWRRSCTAARRRLAAPSARCRTGEARPRSGPPAGARARQLQHEPRRDGTAAAQLHARANAP